MKPISILVAKITDEQFTAYLRFENPKKDRIFSSTSWKGIHGSIDTYISKLRGSYELPDLSRGRSTPE